MWSKYYQMLKGKQQNVKNIGSGIEPAFFPSGSASY